MDLEVREGDDVHKILTSVRKLVFDVLIPHIIKVEEEVRLLREVTWPVCQSLRENSQLSDLENKVRFLKDIDDDEVKQLLAEKARISTLPVKYSTSVFTTEELYSFTSTYREQGR
jgi:hypothetical protein